MLTLTPVLYRVEESSIMIEQIKPEVYVVREDSLYLDGFNEWKSTPSPFSLDAAKKAVEDYFEGLNG